MKQDTYSRRQGMRRRTTTSRRASQQYENSGSGWVVIGILGLILVGSYFLMEEEQQDQTMNFIHESIAWVESQFSEATNEEVFSEQPSKEVPTEMNTIITQGNIVKILAYTWMDTSLLEETKIGQSWYDKYYELLHTDEQFLSLDQQYAMKPVTYQDAREIVKLAFGEEYGYLVQFDANTAETHIPMDQFLNLYQQGIIANPELQGITFEDISILATPMTNNELEAWRVLSNQGTYGFEGLILDPYKDATIKVMIKDDEILGVVDFVSTQSIIENVFIEKVEDHQITVQINGNKFIYTSDTIQSQNEGQVGQITVYNSKIIDYSLQADTDVDTILRVTDTYIEFEKAGIIQYDEILVYTGLEDTYYSSKSQLFSGMKVTYTLENEKVNTVKVVDDAYTEDIRVVLTKDGLGNYTHDTVKVTSSEDCIVTYGTRTLKLEAGAVWDISTFDWGKEGTKLIIKPENEGLIEIQSMTRQNKYPQYAGTIEIYKEDTGYNVVNVVGIEAYIAHVIPSEMPTSYGLEAAKVQAVAARSYAVTYQTNSKFVKYGAQVDDTTSSQVYNNVATTELAKQAAEATKGEVMMYDEKVVSGNFFATSSGYTANYGETWASGEIFPTNTPTYLVSEQQYIGMRDIEDITIEEEAYNFFTLSADEVDAFDNHSPWFRWNVTLDQEEINHMINSTIHRLSTQNSNMVKVLDASENKWVEGEVESIGTIKDIEIRERGSGGNIMELVVIGDEEVVQISTEYLIRNLLAPIQRDSTEQPIQIERADGSTVDNMMMLPSAFFSMDIEYEDQAINQLIIYGGGFGHGVGMSQDGVKGMVERGYEYEEILTHYYQNVEIEQL